MCVNQCRRAQVNVIHQAYVSTKLSLHEAGANQITPSMSSGLIPTLSKCRIQRLPATPILYHDILKLMVSCLRKSTERGCCSIYCDHEWTARDARRNGFTFGVACSLPKRFWPISNEVFARKRQAPDVAVLVVVFVVIQGHNT